LEELSDPPVQVQLEFSSSSKALHVGQLLATK